jgi:hypothetical protein
MTRLANQRSLVRALQDARLYANRNIWLDHTHERERLLDLLAPEPPRLLKGVSRYELRDPYSGCYLYVLLVRTSVLRGE